MEAFWVPVLVALIGGPVMWLLHRFDRRNTAQHEGNMGVLYRIENKVDKLDERVDIHIAWHTHKDDNNQ